MTAQPAPRYTSDAAGQVYLDGALLWQVALSTRPRDREAMAQELAALLNAAEEQGRPGRRIFTDGERYEFLRPADMPSRRVDLSGRSRFVFRAPTPADPGEAGRAIAEAVGGMGPPRTRSSSEDLPLEGL